MDWTTHHTIWAILFKVIINLLLTCFLLENLLYNSGQRKWNVFCVIGPLLPHIIPPVHSWNFRVEFEWLIKSGSHVCGCTHLYCFWLPVSISSFNLALMLFVAGTYERQYCLANSKSGLYFLLLFLPYEAMKLILCHSFYLSSCALR